MKRIANLKSSLIILSILLTWIGVEGISSAAFASTVIAHIDAETIRPSNMITRIPKQVEGILRRQKSLARCFHGSKRGSHLNLTGEDQFLARSVSLRNQKPDGLIVAPGSLACGMGADIFHFWIFEHHGQRYRLVLNTYALVVDVLQRRIHGYHLIRITAHSANTEWRSIYEFTNGKGYMPRQCSQRKWSGGVPEHWERIRCPTSNSKPYR